MTDYNGWKNRSTWNVALCLSNDEPIYRGAVEFMKDYKGKTPYQAFMKDCGLEGQKTPDGISWVSHLLDYEALNEMMRELT